MVVGTLVLFPAMVVEVFVVRITVVNGSVTATPVGALVKFVVVITVVNGGVGTASPVGALVEVVAMVGSIPSCFRVAFWVGSDSD